MSGNLETRTLLFSDIEGSTRLQAATGDGYADILATHTTGWSARRCPRTSGRNAQPKATASS